LPDDERAVRLVAVFIRRVQSCLDFLIHLVFDEGCKVGKKHVEVELLEDRGGRRPVEGFDLEALFELEVFRLHRPSAEIKLAEHIP